MIVTVDSRGTVSIDPPGDMFRVYFDANYRPSGRFMVVRRRAGKMEVTHAFIIKKIKMKKEIWFGWKRGESLPYWLNGSSTDYKVGEDGVRGICEVEGPLPVVIICFHSDSVGSSSMKVVGVPYMIRIPNKV